MYILTCIGQETRSFLKGLPWSCTHFRLFVAYRRVLDWCPDLLHTYNNLLLHKPLCLLFSTILDFRLKRLPQFYSSAPRRISRQPNCSAKTSRNGPRRKHNLSIVQEACLPHHCIGTVVLLLLHTCSLEREPRNERYSGSAIPALRRHVTIRNARWWCLYVKEFQCYPAHRLCGWILSSEVGPRLITRHLLTWIEIAPKSNCRGRRRWGGETRAGRLFLK
jgi:hypothetical protein